MSDRICEYCGKHVKEEDAKHECLKDALAHIVKLTRALNKLEKYVGVEFYCKEKPEDTEQVL